MTNACQSIFHRSSHGVTASGEHNPTSGAGVTVSPPSISPSISLSPNGPIWGEPDRGGGSWRGVGAAAAAMTVATPVALGVMVLESEAWSLMTGDCSLITDEGTGVTGTQAATSSASRAGRT